MTPDQLDNGIIVQSHQRDKWMERLHAARLADLDARIISNVYISDYPADVAKVMVESRSGVAPRIVTAIQKSDPLHGLITEVECDCPAGQTQHVCCHAAMALFTLKWFPFPVLPTSIHNGTHVQITTGVHKGRVGVVEGTYVNGKGMMTARVTDPEAKQTLGRYGLAYLVPAPRPPSNIPAELVELGADLLMGKQR